MSTAGELKRPYSAAFICFIPDYGHLQPILKIADALTEAGFDVNCYLADECSPLIGRFKFGYSLFENANLSEQKKILAKIFSRGIFFNSVCGYIHYLMVAANMYDVVGGAARKLKQQLSERRPDVIICDGLWFVETYARISKFLGVPLIVNSFDGSLAYNQSTFVRTFGISTTPAPLQRIVEIVHLISKRLCPMFYRIRYLRTWLRVRESRRAAELEFEREFPLPPDASGTADWIVIGTASLERDRLSGLINVGGAEKREFPAIRFRSNLPFSGELREWAERDSDQPIVYVSFGSAVELDRAFATAVYEGLRHVAARVLWSLPASQKPLLSNCATAENIRLESFVPQAEILDLPTVRCFVTQAGPHSIQEALFGGTPMLCIPFFVDQAYNSSLVQHLGVGQRLWRRNVSPQSISTAVREILTKKSYLDKAREIRADLIRKEGGPAVVRFFSQLVHSSKTGEDASTDKVGT